VTNKINEKPMITPVQRINIKEPCLSGLIPHGGGIEKLNNEERLNILSDPNFSKIDADSVFKKREKSIDLSMKSNGLNLYKRDIVANKLINNNKLSKYLTSFIGKKDFRTTEERELDKCTFNPKIYSKHRRYRTIKAKLTDYIKGEVDISEDDYMLSKHENFKIINKNNSSSHRGKSLANPLASSLVTSDDGYLNKNKGNNSNSISIINEMTADQNIYSSKTPSNLGIVLTFGYSHQFKERKYYKTLGSSSKAKNIANREKHVKSPTHTVRLSQHNQSSGIKSKELTPTTNNDKKRALSINSAINL